MIVQATAESANPKGTTIAAISTNQRVMASAFQEILLFEVESV